MKKILLSLGVIAIVAAVSISATGAFFSDTETSTANVFTAGAIDLKIDSTATYNGQPVESSTWQEKDLIPTSDKFFNFDDIKPGDSGENNVSIHVINNDAWVCAAVTNLQSDDNGLTGPEAKVDSTGGAGEGELHEEMVWKIWRDDGAGDGIAGDNIQNGSEVILASGNPSAGVLPLYDSTTATGPLTGVTTSYIGITWELPAVSGNITQTDSLSADISFYTVQSRNNLQFKCSDWEPAGDEAQDVWVETTQTEGDASFVEDGEKGNVLKLVTIDDNNSRVRWTNNTLNIDLDIFTGISYDSKQVSAFDTINGNATMRLIVDLDGDINTVDTVEITYEPYYNIFTHNDLNSPSIVPGTWQSWQTTMVKGKFWANGGFLGATPNGGAYDTNFTLAQVLAAHSDAKIVGISLGMGTWNKDQVVLVDDLIINGSPYSLEN